MSLFDTLDALDKEDPSTATAAPAATPAPSNVLPLFATIDAANQKDQATQNLQTAQSVNPDQAGQALDASRKTGIPYPAAQQNLPEAQKTAALQSNVEQLDDHPALTKFLASDPVAAQVAQDDFDKLGPLEKMWDALKSGATTGMIGNQKGREGANLQAENLVGADTTGTQRNIDALNSQLGAQPKMTGALGHVQNFAGFLTGLVDNAIQGGGMALAGTAAGATVGSAFAGVGAVPGAIAGAAVGEGVGFNADMARVAAGNAYLAMGQIRDSSGLPLSEAGKQFGAVFTGAATYALGTYASAIESKLVGQTAEKLATQAMTKAVQTPTFTRAVASFVGDTAVGSAKGAAVMTAMEASSIIGEEIAKTVSSGDFKTDPGEIVDRLTDAAINGAVLLGSMHGAMRGLSLYGDMQSAVRAQGQAEMFKNIMAGSAESKLRDRDQQGFQDFVQQQTEGTPIENVYLPAQKVRELYQSAKGTDPLGFVKDLQEQLGEAGPDGEVVIPAADFVSHLAGTPLADSLRDDLRIGDDSMSVNEAKQYQKEYADRLKEATDQAAETPEVDSGQKIADEVREQATGAGYSEPVASQYAQLYASRYTARGERMGIDPYDAYKQSGITIQKGEANQEPVPGRELAQGERGSIRFSDGKAAISLFKGADPSTAIHESGHAWLEELAQDAGSETAPDQVKEDMQTVRDWLGNDGGELTTPQHEQFARAAERYLMEGKAPSGALARVFSRFKGWLTKIYKTVSGLDTPINDDIRGVFDRLLATDQELAEAKQSTGLEPNFKSREDAGMTAAEWKAYTSAIDRANQQAESALLDKTMAQVRRQRTAEYKEEHAKAAEESAKEVDARPEIAAMNRIRSDTNLRLDAADVKRVYPGAEMPRGMTAKEGNSPDMVAEALGYGSGEELVNALDGLRKQQDALKAAGDKRSVRQVLIDQAADQKMAERAPDQLSEASIRDEAMAAIHSDQRAALLAQELRYLKRSAARELEAKGAGRKAVKQVKTEEDWKAAEADLMAKIDKAKDQNKIDALKEKLVEVRQSMKDAKANEATTQSALREAVNVSRPMLDAIRAHVDTILANKTISDVGRFGAYLRDERKAAREVQQAILKKDWATAAQAKQRQILSHVIYTRAKEASAEIDRGTKTMKALVAKPAFKTIAQEYTDQIHSLLSRFGLDSGRGEELARGKTKTLEQFVTDKAAHGYDLSVDPTLYTMAKGLADLKLSQFRVLNEAIDSLKEIGRGEKMITVDGVERDFDEVKRELAAAIRDLGERAKSDYYDPKDAGLAAAAKENVKSILRGIDAALVKPEALFDQIDRGDWSGIANQAIFRPLKEAQGREDQWHAEAGEAVKSAVKEAGGRKWSNRLDDNVPTDANLLNPKTGRPMRMTRKQMVSMALNWGNAGNKAKLADGWGWSQPAIKAFLDKNMGKEDWQFAQRVWNIFESRKEDLDALQRRTTGVGLALVDAERFQTPHGDFAGGYYPIVYDPLYSLKTETHAEVGKAHDLFTNGYMRATTPKGHTIERVEGVQRPIQLSLDIAPWKIGQTLHDLAFRESIMGADRLLSADSIKSAMDDTFGPEYRKQLRPWLQHLANSRNIDDASLGFWDNAIKKGRLATVIVGIGFRLSTVLKHGMTALSNSVGEIGGANMLKATASFYGPGMADKWKFITDRSAEMKFRLNAYDKDTTGAYNQVIGDSAYSRFQKGAQHYGHMAVSYLDMGSAAPTWLAAYTKAIGDGIAEKDAGYVADKAVRNAHGAQGLTDTAQIQRAGGAADLINMFYGFFNHIYNRQRVIAMDASSGIKNLKSGNTGAAIRDFGSVLGRSFWYIAMPAMIEALVQKGLPNQDQDEGWGEYAAKAIAAEIPAGIPIVRDIAKAWLEGKDYEGSPLINSVNNILRGGHDLLKMTEDQEPSKNMGKNVATAAGLLTGLPLPAPFVAGKFLWDYGNGDADPQSIGDWYDGLSKGHVGK